jgi:hypothetical protein
VPGENRRNKKQPDQGPEQQHEEETETEPNNLSINHHELSLGQRRRKKQIREGLMDTWTLILKGVLLDVQIRDWKENRDEDTG